MATLIAPPHDPCLQQRGHTSSALVTVVPGPAQYRAYPCLSTRFHMRPGVTEREMMRIGAACANPPAPGLLYAVISRCATPGHYIELEVYKDFGTLMHSIERFSNLPGINDTLDSLVFDCEMWIGFLAHLPRKYQPAWTTVYEQLYQQTTTAGSVAAAATTAMTEPEANTFDPRYFTLAVPYAPDLDPGGPLLLSVAIPHTYEPEPVRYAVGAAQLGASSAIVPSRDRSNGGGASPETRRDQGQGWRLRNDACGDVVFIPDVSAALVRAVDLCTALGWPAESYPTAKIAPASLPRPLVDGASDKPRNVVVECASGPRRRCYADVAGVLGGRVPRDGDQVVIRIPATGAKAAAAAPVRIGTVVAVSSWCKRKAVAGVAPPVVLRFATPDDHAREALLRRRYVDGVLEAADVALEAVGGGGGTPLSVVDAWCSLDERSFTVAIATVDGAWTPALAELRRHVAKRLPRSMHLSVLAQRPTA